MVKKYNKMKIESSQKEIEQDQRIDGFKGVFEKVGTFRYRIFILIPFLVSLSCSTHKNLKSQLQSFSQKNFYDKYNMVVTTELPNYSYAKYKLLADSVKSSAINQSVGRIQAEFEKIPSVLLKKLRMKNIHLVDNIVVEGRNVGGGYISEIKSMVLDNGVISDKVIHHELCHSLDDGPLKEYFEKWTDDIYGSQASTTYHHSYEKQEDTNYKSRPTGFISQYAKTFPLEDRAEVFEFLMTGQEHSLFIDEGIYQRELEIDSLTEEVQKRQNSFDKYDERQKTLLEIKQKLKKLDEEVEKEKISMLISIKNDSILQKKITLMKKQLHEASDGEMDEEFFENLKKKAAIDRS